MDPDLWMQRTARGVGKPRSPQLRNLDAAVRLYSDAPDPLTLKRLGNALAAWKESKGGGWQRSIRNADGAVAELDAWIRNERRRFRTNHGFGAEVALKALAIADHQRENVHQACVDWLQTLSLGTGMPLTEWNEARKQWETRVVGVGERAISENGGTARFELVKRGTVLEVRVHCKSGGERRVPFELKSRWRTAVLSCWNHRALLVDRGRRYEIRFDLVWNEGITEAYAIKRVPPPPRTYTWGDAFFHIGICQQELRYSEILMLLLRSSDERLQELIRMLGGPVSFRPIGETRWRIARGLEIPVLSNALKGLGSRERFWVKSAVHSGPQGPFRPADHRLRDLISRGGVRSFTPVRRESSEAWHPASTVPEIRDLFVPDKQRNNASDVQDTTHTMNDFGDLDRKGICHEFGHMIGCPDEYSVIAIHNTGQTWDPAIHNLPSYSADSIMNNPTRGKIEARHFACILREYNRWQNARATIELVAPAT